EAINAGGVETGFTSALSTATPAATPVAAAPSGVAASSITANWGANGNPIGTAYLAQISTDSFATVNASSQTLNTNTAFLGLTANTTYYFQVRAVGHNGQATAFTALASTMTLLQAPGAAATAFTVVDLASVTVQWTSGGNGTGTTYTAQISTDNFTTVNFSSATLNLSAFFGTGGAGAALTPNTTYFFQVRAVSGGNASAFLSLGSTATLAAQPASPALTVVGLSSTAFNWSANGNPSGTSYRAQISTDGFATVNSSSATLNAAAAFAGLVPNTTYFLRVAAAGHNGQTTAFAATLTTATYAAAPTAAAAANLGTSSITANWSANANPAGTTYLVQISTDNFTTVNASSSTLNLSALFGTGGAGAALTPNTTYFFQVQAVGHNGSATAFVALPSTPTLA
ncbi:MAG: fibronectin type III domain-containing protein, partial [Elusimicrobia bacterium]|nr:fibronectin type III domain-containing protein [Elusimicrobiota bacterium]